MIENKKHPYHQKMISKGLRTFIENQILQYPVAKSVPIHFVGSVAHFLKDEIALLLKEYDLTLGVVERHPIRGLVKNKIKLK